MGATPLEKSLEVLNARIEELKRDANQAQLRESKLNNSAPQESVGSIDPSAVSAKEEVVDEGFSEMEKKQSSSQYETVVNPNYETLDPKNRGWDEELYSTENSSYYKSAETKQNEAIKNKDWDEKLYSTGNSSSNYETVNPNANYEEISDVDKNGYEIPKQKEHEYEEIDYKDENLDAYGEAKKTNHDLKKIAENINSGLGKVQGALTGFFKAFLDFLLSIFEDRNDVYENSKKQMEDLLNSFFGDLKKEERKEKEDVFADKEKYKSKSAENFSGYENPLFESKNNKEEENFYYEISDEKNEKNVKLAEDELNKPATAVSAKSVEKIGDNKAIDSSLAL